VSVAQVLPFVIFGIGLDDAFILIAAYTRTDVSKDTVERVHDTVDEVGMSIFMTTATSVLAFGLGCISSLPAVRWLCLYALFTIAIDFVYQITFFIALIVIDERRVADRRRDCLVCCVVKRPADEAMEEDAPSEKRIGERVMAWYADILLIPKVKVLVIAVFTALLFVCAFSASKLELDFDTTITLPDDSYIISFTEAAQDYIQRPSVSPFVYFRNVDHSDPAVRAQMEAYVNDLVAIDWISDQPVDFWLRDYNKYVAENENDLRGLTFNETIHMFVDDPKYDNGGSIMFDINGNIHASRTRVGMDRVNQSQVYDMLAALKDQRQVGSEQPINHGGGDWAFFTFSHVYYLWEFVAATVDELKLTTIIGVAAVSLMSVLFLPHWSGVLFVSPLITILYVNLLGFLQLFGITINAGRHWITSVLLLLLPLIPAHPPYSAFLRLRRMSTAVTFVALVISIGLLVDFVMHIALRYFESTEIGRVEKTKDVLRTMGIPVLLGGLSTFFGIMPLALASNGVLRIFFISFVGIVSLGVAHALILFPVVLSVIGPN
jgi:Niemann-Pick C1 protein